MPTLQRNHSFAQIKVRNALGCRDIVFSSNENEKVKNLNAWRDRVNFHNDERELFRQNKFENENPLPDIGLLIDSGSPILNRYSQYFDTTVYSKGCRDWKDMRFVFEH